MKRSAFKKYAVWRTRICCVTKMKRPGNIQLWFEFVGVAFAAIILPAIASVLGKSSGPEYRRSPRYRKVYKEGIFFTTVEYHERFGSSPTLASAVYKKLLPPETGNGVMTITWSDGSVQEYYGPSTVWYEYPMMRRAGTSTEYWLSGIYEYIRVHGNPYPTAHKKA